MRDVVTQPNGLILVSDVVRTGTDDRPLRSARARGELRRIRRGAYIECVPESSDTDYDLRIAAVVGTRRAPITLSHESAARLWCLPIVNDWPFEVHATVGLGSARRSKNGVVVHRHELEEADRDIRNGISVTSLARTLVDVARSAPFRDAVAALDHALAHALTSKEELLACLERAPSSGSGRAARAIEFASPLAMMPGESYSRALVHELGFPAPELQREFTAPDGRRRRADFWWEHIRLVGEFDGRHKYADPRYTHGRSPEAVVWEEKLRENELREFDARITRWVWSDLEQVQPFIRRLEAAGLRRMRPPAFR